MKLENQVNSVSQSIRLKELGIAQQSFLYWFKNENITGSFWDVAQMLEGTKSNYSAFTVAELGAALPELIGRLGKSAPVSYRLNPDFVKSKKLDKSKVWVCEATGDECDYPDTHPTEAQARAAMLIYLLENKHITPESVNERLNNS